uniref:Uncharacterized protein n=1 Tax=Arundo donax TaxID=35708 RepID=A0A0A9B5L6_ARUDO
MDRKYALAVDIYGMLANEINLSYDERRV